MSTVAVPATAEISVSVITSMLLERSMRSTRYCDMVDLSAVPRTTMRTLRARDERCTAAWPAEFPPPTTITSSSRQRSASVAMAAW